MYGRYFPFSARRVLYSFPFRTFILLRVPSRKRSKHEKHKHREKYVWTGETQLHNRIRKKSFNFLAVYRNTFTFKGSLFYRSFLIVKIKQKDQVHYVSLHLHSIDCEGQAHFGWLHMIRESTLSCFHIYQQISHTFADYTINKQEIRGPI